MRTFHIITFGCQMNEHDSERMAGILEQQGCVPSAGPEDADVIVLNTCSIREKAEQKFYSELGRLRLLEERPNGRRRIAVAGCIAQQEGGRILSRVPGVDLVVGTADLSRLSLLAGDGPAPLRPVVATGGDPDHHLARLPASRRDRVKAWVPVMYGCDNFCAYCVVPYLRGRERSRPAEDVVQEVRDLAGRGYREVTLLGQNVNSYGKGAAGAVPFPGLLRMVDAVEGIERIRFVTSHPRDLSDELIRAMRDLPKVCEALHLPAQSGSDRVLASMRRGYTADEYREKVRRLRDAVPDIALTTDIIAGFPGETEEDLERTLDLLGRTEFDNIFAFKYSVRPKTAARDLPGHLPEEVKDERLERVLALQRKVTLDRNRGLIGSVREVLVDGRSRRGGMLTGRTRQNRVVNFPGDEGLIGRLVKVRIDSAGPNSLAGTLCE